MVEKVNEDGRWIFQQEGTTSFLRQASTGLFIGSSIGKQVSLVPKATDNERIRLEAKGQRMFLIRNLQGLVLTPYGTSLLWGNVDSAQCYWTFETSNTRMSLDNMAGCSFGLRSARGGYIGGVKSGRLTTVARLQCW